MKKKIFIGLLVLTASCLALAGQSLEQPQIRGILERLCRRPSDGWIQQGRIEAIHEKLDAKTDELVETVETVVTDGNRFTWKIRTTRCEVRGKPLEEGSDDLQTLNTERQFIWDGQKYTLYFETGKQALVYDSPNSIPVQVSGPLTAGFVPWGQGIFTYETLAASVVSATTKQTEEGEQVQLMIQPPGSPSMLFVLDPARDYAVLSYTLLQPEESKVVHTYGNFVLRQGRFIPTNILIDRYISGQLSASDSWEFVLLQDVLSEQENFAVPFQEQDLIEYHTPVLEKPSYYRHSSRKNIDSLLEKRVVNALKKDIVKQNCASAAAGYVVAAFGREATDEQLALLVEGAGGMTSMYRIRQFIQDKGLSCLAVKTTLGTLRQRKDCKIILHLPQTKHFVVLDRIDTEKVVWLVDLDRELFYHDMAVSQFKQEWAGIALLVSKQPIALKDGDKPVPDAVLKQIMGSAGYSCTRFLQDYKVHMCPKMLFYTCYDRYTIWYRRYGCEINPEGGLCKSVIRIGYVYSSCIENRFYPGDCNITGEFTPRFMRACQE